LSWVNSQNLWQSGADRTTRVAVAARLLAGAVRGDVRGEREQLFVPAVSRDQVGEPIPARASALGALDAQHIELADQVREDDRASYSIRPGFYTFL
jgi:hypothetical protein